MTTDSVGEKYNTDQSMSFSKSTRPNSQHLFSTSAGSDFIVNRHYKSNSLNDDEVSELIMDENYL